MKTRKTKTVLSFPRIQMFSSLLIWLFFLSCYTFLFSLPSISDIQDFFFLLQSSEQEEIFPENLDFSKNSQDNIAHQPIEKETKGEIKKKETKGEIKKKEVEKIQKQEIANVEELFPENLDFFNIFQRNKEESEEELFPSRNKSQNLAHVTGKETIPHPQGKTLPIEIPQQQLSIITGKETTPHPQGKTLPIEIPQQQLSIITGKETTPHPQGKTLPIEIPQQQLSIITGKETTPHPQGKTLPIEIPQQQLSIITGKETTPHPQGKTLPIEIPQQQLSIITGKETTPHPQGKTLPIEIPRQQLSIITGKETTPHPQRKSFFLAVPTKLEEKPCPLKEKPCLLNRSQQQPSIAVDKEAMPYAKEMHSLLDNKQQRMGIAVEKLEWISRELHPEESTEKELFINFPESIPETRNCFPKINQSLFSSIQSIIADITAFYSQLISFWMLDPVYKKNILRINYFTSWARGTSPIKFHSQAKGSIIAYQYNIKSIYHVPIPKIFLGSGCNYAYRQVTYPHISGKGSLYEASLLFYAGIIGHHLSSTFSLLSGMIQQSVSRKDCLNNVLKSTYWSFFFNPSLIIFIDLTQIYLPFKVVSILNLFHYRQPEFEEKDNQGFMLKIKKMHTNLFRSEVGLQYDKTYSFNGKYCVPYLRLAWMAQTHKENRHGMVFSAGLQFSSWENRISLSIDGKSELKRKEKNYFVGGGLRFLF